MNYRQLQCALLLSEVRNFSQVAEQLNISQPTLSKMILNLEKDLGVRLFDRTTVPVSLTPAGEYFFREAKGLMRTETHLRQAMEEFQTGKRGHLTIGVSPFRCVYLMPELVRKVQQRYPGVLVTLVEEGSDLLQKHAAEGTVDFAIVNLPVDDTLLDVQPLTPERVLLAVPERLAQDVPVEPEKSEEGYPVADLARCGHLPFIVLGRQQVHRILFDKLCANAGVIPNITAEVVGITSAWALVRGGVGAAMLPQPFVGNDYFREDIRFFALKGSGAPRTPAVISRKGKGFSEYASYAVSLLQEM